MNKVIFFLVIISAWNVWTCKASDLAVKETTDFSIKYNLDGENLISFMPETYQASNETLNVLADKELDELIVKAIAKQKNHPTFDLKYAINHETLRKKILNKTEKYYRFPENHIKYKGKIPQETSLNIETNSLKNLILTELNIQQLSDNLNEELLSITCTAIIDNDAYIEKKLLFYDQHVGFFEVLILIPKQDKARYPAIIGLHGHRQTSYNFKEDFFVEDLVNEGFIVIIPAFRAMGLTETEYIISKKLLLNGFTLMGIRVYETLLVEKYLQHLEYVEEENIGIFGHSGGCSIASFVTVLCSRIKAKVVDHESNFMDRTDLYGIYDEILPALVEHSETIHNYNSTPENSKFKAPYEYPGCQHKVLDFFKKYLKK